MAFLDKPMLLQILQDIHNGLFAVMVIENFVS